MMSVPGGSLPLLDSPELDCELARMLPLSMACLKGSVMVVNKHMWFKSERVSPNGYWVSPK